MPSLSELRRAALSLASRWSAQWTVDSSTANGGSSQQRQPAGRPDETAFIRVRELLERILTRNILPFWDSSIIDARCGGYRLNHGLDGRWRGPAPKSLVTQARSVWFFSRLVNSPYSAAKYLSAARHGYEFLRDRMWDEKYGGFYWEVDASGRKAVRPEKHAYGQAFGLYALAEYARASTDPESLEMAGKLFDLLEKRLRDPEHGGYLNVAERDWSSGARRERRHRPVKQMNTHLHLLEAFTSFLLLRPHPLVRQRLVELILINGNTVVCKNVGACTDVYSLAWERLGAAECARVSYGHDLENIWLLEQACVAAEIPGAFLHDLYRTLFDYALRWGYDHESGGFYDSGGFNQPADRRDKIWWVQAEASVSALAMYRLTGDRLYWDCFTRTLEWIAKHQCDWEHGDWYEKIDERGQGAGVKAGPWKGPYHNGRAMLNCLQLLDGLRG